jgi:hypothetical protein
VSVIKRRLAFLLDLLTPRTDLLMNPYFVPVLAQLLMEGLGRRAVSHAAEAGPQSLVPAYARAPTDQAAALARLRGEQDDGRGLRASRHFGRPGPLG